MYFSRTASQQLILLTSKKQIVRVLRLILTFTLLFLESEISQGRPRHFVCTSYRKTQVSSAELILTLERLNYLRSPADRA
jgi:hypothetical protein